MSDEPAEQEAEAEAEAEAKAEAPAKPKKKKKRRAKPTSDAPVSDREPSDDAEAEPGAEDEPAEEAPSAAARPAGISTKTKIITAVALGLVVVGGIFLVQRASAPKVWSIGSEVDVVLTLVAGDVKNLQCASKTVIAGAHCAFEDGTKEFAKDDKPVLMPYTTTDKRNLLGTGLWTDAGMTAAKLPDTRFSVKCKFKVEGAVPTPQVRWQATGKWDDTKGEWPAGTLHSCSVVTDGAPAASGAPVAAPGAPAPKPAGS